MPEDRISELRRGYADEDYLGLEPPDLGPLQAVAEGEELTEAASRLADAYSRPLPADDPLAPLARDLARALTEAGSRCTTARRATRCTGLAECACCP